jgi:hypothetical protein
MWFLSEETNLPKKETRYSGRRTEDRASGAVAQGAGGWRANFLKEGVRALSQAIMEMEVEEHKERHITSAAQLARASATATAKSSGTRGSGPSNWTFRG